MRSTGWLVQGWKRSCWDSKILNRRRVCERKQWFQAHRMQVYLPAWKPWKSTIHVEKYIIPMDPMGFIVQFPSQSSPWQHVCCLVSWHKLRTIYFYTLILVHGWNTPKNWGCHIFFGEWNAVGGKFCNIPNAPCDWNIFLHLASI